MFRRWRVLRLQSADASGICSCFVNVLGIQFNSFCQKITTSNAVVETITLLEKYGIDHKKLSYKPRTTESYYILKRHLETMEEIGVNITQENISKLPTIIHEKIPHLKERGIIPKNHNVLSSCLSHLPPFPFNPSTEFKTLSEVKGNMVKGVQYFRPLHSRWTKKSDIAESESVFKEEDDVPSYTSAELLELEGRSPYDTVYNAVSSILRQYLSWRLKCSLDELDPKIVRHRCIKKSIYKSLRSRVILLDMLEHDFKLTKRKIVNNMYLLNTDEMKLRSLNDESFQMAGVRFRDLVPPYPRLLMVSREQLIDIEMSLKEAGISEGNLRKCVDIFTLSAGTIKTRIEIIKNNPELSIFLSLPRGLLLIYHFNKFVNHLKLLKEHNHKIITFDKLTATKAEFERILREGNEKTNGGDIVRFLALELNSTDKVLRKYLTKHNYKYQVPLINIKDTLHFLMDYGFSSEVIIEALPIVLYPKEKILPILERISNDEESLAQFGLSKGFVNVPQDSFKNGTKNYDKRLSLCVYYIERDFHFTGDGVWK